MLEYNVDEYNILKFFFLTGIDLEYDWYIIMVDGNSVFLS